MKKYFLIAAIVILGLFFRKYIWGAEVKFSTYYNRYYIVEYHLGLRDYVVFSSYGQTFERWRHLEYGATYERKGIADTMLMEFKKWKNQ